MREKAKKKWEKIRGKGKKEFIFRTGGVLFGIILMGIVFTITQIIFSFWQHNYSFEFMTGEFIGQNIFRLIFAYPSGLLLGWLVWTLNEWSYSRSW